MENGKYNISDRRTADWDINYAPKNYLTLVCAQVASALFSFAAVWLATRVLGPSGYGSVVAIIAAAQAVAQLTVNWTAVSVTRFGVEEFVETGAVAKAFWTRLWILVPNLALVLATAPFWLPFISSLLKLAPGAYILIVVTFLASSLWIHVQHALQGAKLVRLQGGLLSFERFLVFTIIALAALTSRASLTSIALAYVLSPLAAATLGMWRLRQYVFPVKWVDKNQFRRMVRFSWPVLPASFVGYLSTNYLDAFFIAHYLSRADLAVYAVAYQFSGMALQIPLLAGSLLMPLFVTLHVSEQKNRAERFISDLLPICSLLWGLLCALAAVTAGYLFPLMFGPAFRSLEILLWPLMAAAALVAPVVMGYAPYSASRSVTYIAMIGAVIAASLNVVLNFLLIPRFGLLGCAWATAIAYGMNMVVVVLLVHSKLGVVKTWTLWSVSPIIMGAMCASWFGSSAVALAPTILLSGVLVLFHHKSIVTALRVLENYRALQWRGGHKVSETVP